MAVLNLSAYLFAGLLMLAGASHPLLAADYGIAPTSKNCLGCHGIKNFSIPDLQGRTQRLHISPEGYGAGVHDSLACNSCHHEIKGIPHQNLPEINIDCTGCHLQTWKKAVQDGTSDQYRFLGTVVEQIGNYRDSIHAQPNRLEPGKLNAYCSDCHDAHYLTPINSERGDPGRLKVPDICGRCHSNVLAKYANSVHGVEVLGNGNAEAAVCVDCHTSHSIEKAEGDPVQLAIGKNCGNCHEDSMTSYIETYHGTVTTLGEAHTAKCYDCHGSHGIKRPEDPESMVHKDNVVETCNQCHEDGGEGFATFYPHGTMDNFDKYPEMYIAYNFMIWLLIGVFAFFYLHCLLWFYAEWRDRRKARKQQHIDLHKLNGEEQPHGEEHSAEPEKHVRRFGPIWRLAHLILALGVMILVITGMALMFPHSAWAPLVVKAFGGIEMAGTFHRIGGLMFAGVFFGTLFYALYYMIRNWRTWKPFGPNSLIPNLNDLRGVIGMFKWFFGFGPRPQFDRWAYWEKFDFWAPFWGLTIVGVSGVMLWNPELTSHYLPGWSFNVGTIVHGEEAFLAAVFLFSVHYFNCHFRPDKLPQDICMFTGCIPLHEYKHEHAIEYQRLVETGELEKYLVDAPSKPMRISSLILGAVLILIGVAELILVVGAFFGWF